MTMMKIALATTIVSSLLLSLSTPCLSCTVVLRLHANAMNFCCHCFVAVAHGKYDLLILIECKMCFQYHYMYCFVVVEVAVAVVVVLLLFLFVVVAVVAVVVLVAVQKRGPRSPAVVAVPGSRRHHS